MSLDKAKAHSHYVLVSMYEASDIIFYVALWEGHQVFIVQSIVPVSHSSETTNVEWTSHSHYVLVSIFEASDILF